MGEGSQNILYRLTGLNAFDEVTDGNAGATDNRLASTNSRAADDVRTFLGCLLDQRSVILIADQDSLRTVVLRNEIRLACRLQCGQDVFKLLPYLTDGNSLNRHRTSPSARLFCDKTIRSLETRSRRGHLARYRPIGDH